MSQLDPIFAGAALKSALILAVAWLACACMRRRSAAARHLVWLASAAAVIALPLLSMCVPALRIATPAAIANFQVNATDRSSGEDAAGVSMNPGGHSMATKNIHWSRVVFMVWAAGTSIALLQMLLGYAAIRRMRRSATRLPDEHVELREGEPGTMPMAAGIFKPAVFLPRDAAGWPDDRRRAVLLHEIAHVQRGDTAAQLIARLALSLYWWNPLEWIAWREFLKERERAADDLVLSSGICATDYAAHLLEIARTMHGAAFTGAAVAMARPSQLEGRLMAILDSKRSRTAARRSTMWITAACAIAAIAPIAAVRAQDNSAIPADVEAAIRAAQSGHDSATLDKIAIAAEDQLKFDLARKVLDAALQIRGEVSGTSSGEYGIGVMNLANLELRQHGLVASETLYSQASDLLAKRPEGAQALMKLGEIAIARKNFDAAAAYFQRAQAADPAASAMATMWLADVRIRQGNSEEADALFKSAIALADPKSRDAATVMSVYANFLEKEGRTDESKMYLDQASKTYAASRIIVHPNQTGPDGPFRIGGSVTPPRVLAKKEPEYSEEARLAALQGTVTLSVVIGEDGFAHDIQVTRSLGLELDDKAVAAVSQWKFAPGTKGGEPVPVLATIEVNFRLL